MPDMDNLDQNDIDRLMQKARTESESGGDPAPSPDPKMVPPDAETATVASQPAETAPTTMDQDVQMLLNQAQQAIASVDQPIESAVPGLAPFEFRDLTGAAPNQEAATIDLLRDVELDLRIELGRARMHMQDVLQLRKGSVVPLEKLAGDPADIYVNGRLVARGEILVLSDNFCVRVAELITGDKPS